MLPEFNKPKEYSDNTIRLMAALDNAVTELTKEGNKGQSVMIVDPQMKSEIEIERPDLEPIPDVLNPIGETKRFEGIPLFVDYRLDDYIAFVMALDHFHNQGMLKEIKGA